MRVWFLVTGGCLWFFMASTFAAAIKEETAVFKKWLSSSPDFVIGWDEVVNSDAVKDRREGSPLFHLYLTYWTNRLDFALKNKQIPLEHVEAFSHLCREPDCLTGLDISKMDAAAARLILQTASAIPLFTAITSEDPTKEGSRKRPVVFLQGSLSFPGWGVSQIRKLKQDESKKAELPQWQNLRKIRDFIVANGVREIIVNLPHQFGSTSGVPGARNHYDVSVLVEWGRLVKELRMDLHIVGRCGTFCANYLVPAAGRVIIEPYGYIYTEGSIYGLYTAAGSAESAQRSHQLQQLRSQWLPKIKQLPGPPDQAAFSPDKPFSGLVYYVTEQMLLAFGFIDSPRLAGMFFGEGKIRREQMPLNFINRLSQWAPLVWGEEMWEDFQTYMFDTYRQGDRKSFRNWKREDIRAFVESMNNEDQMHFLEALALFTRAEQSDFQKYARYLEDLRWLWREYTGAYSKAIRDSLRSEESYTYDMLLDMIPHIVRDEGYGEVFSVPKTVYAVPESEKPPAAAPSVELLRKLGINVMGENRRDELKAGVGDRVLYLTGEIIKTCRFFGYLVFYFNAVAAGHSPQPVYTKQVFEKCISRS